MKDTKPGIWHEVLILVLYFSLSTAMSFLLHDHLQSDPEGILLFINMLAVGISSFISLLIIVQLKINIKSSKPEWYYGLIPFSLLFILYLIFIDKDSNESNRYMLSNVVVLIILYGLSVSYKWNKKERSLGDGKE